MALPAPLPVPQPPSILTTESPHDTDLAGRPVLVTGASGFVGRHLCRRLHGLGADVHAVTRPGTTERPGLPVTWHRADLTDQDAIGALACRLRPAAVFHLASRVQGHRDSDLALPMLEANTRAAVTLMAATRELADCRVVLAGSVEEPRGDSPPCSPYAAAKAAATGYARLFHAQWDLPVTVLRIAMVYGPDQPDHRKLVPYVSRCLLAGTAPALGNGRRPVDWVYVDDVCDAFLRAAGRPGAAGAVLDIGSGQVTTVADVVRTLAELTGYTGPLGFGQLAERRHDLAHVADVGPAAHHLGWHPRTDLRTGLTRTVAWHRLRARPPTRR